ncbi:MAG: hypothetical protein ACRDGM_19325, partial [bacterium]
MSVLFIFSREWRAARIWRVVSSPDPGVSAPPPEEVGRDLVLRPWKASFRRFYPHYAFYPQDFDAPIAPEEVGRDLVLRPWVLRRTKFYPYYQFFPQDE